MTLYSGIVLTTLLTLGTAPRVLADWPQWRGPARDGHSADFHGSTTWPATLATRWSVPVGSGYAAPVVAGEQVYLFQREGTREVLAAYELGSGKVLWKQGYASTYQPAPEAKDFGDGPFATPTVAAGKVFTLGVNEVLSAFDAATGKLLWRKDWGSEFKVPRPSYGAAASPLVVDGLVVVYVGGPGKGALVALDAATGAQKWRLEGDGPTYGPPVLATFAGVRQVVTQSQNGLLGADLATGKLLWQREYKVPWENNILTPLVDGERVLLSANDMDLQAFQITRGADGWASTVAWSARAPMYMSSPVLAEGRVYGFSELKKGQLMALEAAGGKILWASPGGLGDHASLVVAGPYLLALTDGGELRVLRRGETYQPLATYTVADSATWVHPAVLSDGRLLLRDTRQLKLLQPEAPPGAR